MLYHFMDKSWFTSEFQSFSDSVKLIVTYGSNVAPLGSTSYAIPVKLKVAPAGTGGTDDLSTLVIVRLAIG